MLVFLPLVLGWVGCEEPREVPTWGPDDHQLPSAEVDSSESAPPEAGEPPTADAVARAAAALYRASCAGCHGVDGRGGGPTLPAGIMAPDLTHAEVQERSDEELARVVRGGRGVMPGFGEQLNERGIAALVEHVRTLRQP